tara:strand:+ start:748 stop:882 length:135 start_codon:yes stop_codon:yes gene_type:complete
MPGKKADKPKSKSKKKGAKKKDYNEGTLQDLLFKMKKEARKQLG